MDTGIAFVCLMAVLVILKSLMEGLVIAHDTSLSYVDSRSSTLGVLLRAIAISILMAMWLFWESFSRAGVLYRPASIMFTMICFAITLITLYYMREYFYYWYRRHHNHQ